MRAEPSAASVPAAAPAPATTPYSLADAAVGALVGRGCGWIGTALFLRSPALQAWHIEKQTKRGFRGPLAERGFIPLNGEGRSRRAFDRSIHLVDKRPAFRGGPGSLCGGWFA